MNLRSLATRLPALLAITAGLALPAAAQDAKLHPDKALLWKITADHLKTPSHLFGSIHLSNERIAQLHPAAEQAFQAAGAVFTEISLDAQSQVAATPLMMRPEGSKLSDSIGPEVREELAKALAEINPAFTPDIFENLKTWAVAAAVVMLPYQLQGNKALDQILWDRATEAGKSTGALEKMADQVAAFEVLTEDEQVTYLRETLVKRAENKELLETMIGDYEAGDAKAIHAALVKSMGDFGDEPELRKLGEKLMKALLADRDVKMAAVIDQQLRAKPEQSFFFAIGAAHLLGDTSIRKHLTDKGYTITSVAE